MSYRAHIQTDFFNNSVRLLVARFDGINEILLSNGEWTQEEPNVEVVNAGIVLPSQAIQAVHDACAVHLGKSLPTQAEISVLREWLDVERRRVDNVLGRDA